MTVFVGIGLAVHELIYTKIRGSLNGSFSVLSAVSITIGDYSLRLKHTQIDQIHPHLSTGGLALPGAGPGINAVF